MTTCKIAISDAQWSNLQSLVRLPDSAKSDVEYFCDKYARWKAADCEKPKPSADRAGLTDIEKGARQLAQQLRRAPLELDWAFHLEPGFTFHTEYLEQLADKLEKLAERSAFAQGLVVKGKTGQNNANLAFLVENINRIFKSHDAGRMKRGEKAAHVSAYIKNLTIISGYKEGNGSIDEAIKKCVTAELDLQNTCGEVAGKIEG
jgi:hypothetical protein